MTTALNRSRGMAAFWLLLTLASSLIPQPAHAQTNFFTVWPGHPDFSPAPPSSITGVEAEYPIVVNVRSLAANDAARRRYSLRMPDGTTKVFTQRVFDPKAGFMLVGPIDVQPDPGVADNGLS